MAKLDEKVRNNGFAKAGIEMALLDGAGKILDVPLHILFGGKVRDSLSVAWPLATGDVAQEIDEAEEMLALGRAGARSEEHTSALQSLMRISYAVFCLQKKKQ